MDSNNNDIDLVEVEQSEKSDAQRLLDEIFSSRQEAADAIVDALRDRKAKIGFLTKADYLAAASMMPGARPHPRTVQRWVHRAQRRHGQPTSGRKGPRFEHDEMSITVVYAWSGNLHQAWMDLVAHGLIDCSETTFREAWVRLPMPVQAYARHGIKGFRSSVLYRMWSAPAPNVVWQMDSHVLDIVAKERGIPFRGRYHSIMDDHTRLNLSSLLTYADANGADVRATVGMALYTRKAEKPYGHVTLGGKPKLLIWDGALANHAEVVVGGLDDMTIPHRPTARYEPTGKGKIERYHRTLEAEAISDLPGYITPGSRELDGSCMWMPENTADIVEWDVVVTRVKNFLHHYNYVRKHQGLGNRTPMQVWAEANIEPEAINAAVLARSFLVPVGTKKAWKIHPQGLHFEGRWYVGAAATLHVGKMVTPRGLPDDSRFVELFDATTDEYLGRVYVPESATEDEAAAIQDARDALYATVTGFRDGSMGVRGDVADTVEDEEPLTPAAAAAKRRRRARGGKSLAASAPARDLLAPGWEEAADWDPNSVKTRGDSDE